MAGTCNHMHEVIGHGIKRPGPHGFETVTGFEN